MDNKYKRLAQNSFWSLIGNAGSKVLGFLLLPLYTRWLGTVGFGESDLITTYSSFLICVMTMCVSDAIFVFTKNEDLERQKVFFSTSLSFVLFLLLVWLLIWGGLDIGFSIYEIRNSFTNNLWLIYGVVVSTFLQQYSQQFVLGIEKIKLYSLIGIIYTLLTFFLSYWLIPIMGVKGYILAVIYSNILTAAYSFVFSRSYSYVSLSKIDFCRLKEVLKYSIPLIPNGIMWWLVSAINRPVMEYYLDYSAIGIYAVASRFPSVIMMVFTVFSVAWNISVFEEYGKDDYEDFYEKTFRMLFLVVVTISSIFIAFSELIVRVFTAPEFYEAWKYMVLLIIGSVFSCLSSFTGVNFGVVKQSKYYLYSSIWGAVAAIALNLLLIPLLGLWGAAISMLLSFAVMMVSRYIYSLKYVKSPLHQYYMGYTIVLGAVACACLYVDNNVARFLLTTLILFFLLFRERSMLNYIVIFIYRRVN